MLLGVINELIHIRTNSLDAALHRRDSVTLTSATDAYASLCAEQFERHICRSSTMPSCQITAEHEDLVRLQALDIFRGNLLCHNNAISKQILFKQTLQIKREELLNRDSFVTNNQCQSGMEEVAESL